MRKLPILIGTLLAIAAPGFAAEDPIDTRQALMSSNGASAGVSGAILKGELDYNPVVGRAAIISMHAAAEAFGDYFPEGSGDDPRTEASPKIWTDMAGFMTELEEFRTKSAAAVEAAGKDGPADVEAFKAAMTPVLGMCKECHETYRVEK